ncbi:MAG: glycosyltransferase family 2 protein [Bacteroidaceae bacterium]|nr:glycosyltransferase family 2 protein [Bacteroidaceae bacterium]
MTISVVSPIYKGEKMLDSLVGRNTAVLQQMIADGLVSDYEIILVNDASPDNSWAKMKEICDRDTHVKGINLSRNFGQHYAITAGLSKVSGDWIVVMDCDLQDRPEEIPNLYKKAQEGYDTVFAEIIERNDRFMKKFTSRAFSYFFAYFTDSPVGKKTNNFGIYRKKVIDAVLSMGDYIRCFPVEVRWVGFNTGYHPVIKDAREEGTSGYTWSKLFAFAFDNIIAFSNKPLKLAMQFGFFIVLLSVCLALFYLIMYLTGSISVSGFTTIVISLWMIAGIVISLIGMVGIYIGRVFDKVKDRPTYIIDESINF